MTTFVEAPWLLIQMRLAKRHRNPARCERKPRRWRSRFFLPPLLAQWRALWSMTCAMERIMRMRVTVMRVSVVQSSTPQRKILPTPLECRFLFRYSLLCKLVVQMSYICNCSLLWYANAKNSAQKSHVWRKRESLGLKLHHTTSQYRLNNYLGLFTRTRVYYNYYLGLETGVEK